MSFNSETYDTNAIATGGGFTIKTAGLYLVSAFGALVGGSGNGVRTIGFTVNGGQVLDASQGGDVGPGGGAADNALSLSHVLNLNVNDIVRLQFWQNSGVAITLLGGLHVCEFACVRLGSVI